MPIRMPILTNLVVSPRIKSKLSTKHQVTVDQIEQCFLNREGVYLVDERDEHQSDAQTLWFVAETDTGRPLKIVFVSEHGNIYVRTAFQPNNKQAKLYYDTIAGKKPNE